MTRTAGCADPGPANAVVLRLAHLGQLSPRDAGILGSLSQASRHLPTHSELCVEGRVRPPMMLLSGWACYQRLLSDGRRQIVRFLLPGDLVGSLDRPGLPAISSAVALTHVMVADADPVLRALNAGEHSAGLSDAIARILQVDEANLCDHVIRLGRQTAYERVIHILLEFHGRMQAVGLVAGNSFTTPLTQEVLGDALGLSVVHINRTLQQLRRDNLLDIRNGKVTLHQPDRMRALVDRTPPGTPRSHVLPFDDDPGGFGGE